jgi:hypothetical protein
MLSTHVGAEGIVYQEAAHDDVDEDEDGDEEEDMRDLAYPGHGEDVNIYAGDKYAAVGAVGDTEMKSDSPDSTDPLCESGTGNPFAE